MKKNFNYWSLILLLISFVLFFSATSSKTWFTQTFLSLGIHPLFIVLGLTFITLILGFMGLAESKDWKMRLMGILTIILSIILFFIILVITFFGSLLS